MSLVVLGDLALGIFFKMVIMRGISAAACLGAAHCASICGQYTCIYVHTYIHTRGDQNKLLPDISDVKPKIYG